MRHCPLHRKSSQKEVKKKIILDDYGRIRLDTPALWMSFCDDDRLLFLPMIILIPFDFTPQPETAEAAAV
jgi:hypothetical protein